MSHLGPGPGHTGLGVDVVLGPGQHRGHRGRVRGAARDDVRSEREEILTLGCEAAFLILKILKGVVGVESSQ